MSYLVKPIAYLTDSDFDSDGNLINPQISKNKISMIMIEGNFCHFCTAAKPAYQKFAEANVGKINCFAIQVDGDQPGEPELNKRIKIIDPTYRGVPDYIAYYDGKFLKKHNGGRTQQDLQSFVDSLNV